MQIDKLRLRLDPTKLATPTSTGAVGHARVGEARHERPLVVSVHGAPVRAWAQKLAKRFDRKPARSASCSATASRHHARPRRPPARRGRARRASSMRSTANTRLPLRVNEDDEAAGRSPSAAAGHPHQPRPQPPHALPRHRSRPPFPVATGQAIYPTPRGRFHIVVKWKNPWWYPPTYDAWAAGPSPVPPGPGQPARHALDGPLRARRRHPRHATSPGSIGYSASHGCIRMQVPDAEWLFDHVDVGTTVFIV